MKANNIFDSVVTDKFSESDWQSVSNEDGTVNLTEFLAAVNNRMKIELISEEEFKTTFVIIKSMEAMFGPFSRDQAVSIAIMYSLNK